MKKISFLILPFMFWTSAKASQLGCEQTITIGVNQAVQAEGTSLGQVDSIKLVNSFQELQVWEVYSQDVSLDALWVVITRKDPMGACSIESIVLDHQF